MLKLKKPRLNWATFVATSICITAICLFSNPTEAQSLAMEVIGSTGGYAEGGGAKIEYTVGEVMIENYSQSIGSISQGFHQYFGNPEMSMMARRMQFEKVPRTRGFSIVTNPVRRPFLIIQFRRWDSDKLVSIYDSMGRKLKSVYANAKDRVSKIDISQFKKGFYFISVKTEKDTESQRIVIVD